MRGRKTFIAMRNSVSSTKLASDSPQASDPASPATQPSDLPIASTEPIWAPSDRLSAAGLVESLETLEQTYRQSFSVVDLASGRLERVSADWLGGDLFSRLSLCEEISRRGQVEVLEDCAPLLMLAVPFSADGEPTDLLAVSTFLTAPVTCEEDVAAAAQALGVTPEHALRWSQSRQIWPAHAVVELGKAWYGQQQGRQTNNLLQSQLADVSAHLLSTFEELSMLHRLSERLSLSSTETELCDLALDWLSEIVPAEHLAITLQATELTRTPSDQPRQVILSRGEPLLKKDEYSTFIERLGNEAPQRCLVLNRDRTESPTWCYPNIDEVISIPIRSNEKVLGWLLALNFRANDHSTDDEFGTVEASLLSSVGAILGVHAGNIDLYREQSEFFESVIRALSSSIDAKDPYTCGHSDRVARIAVCLAKQLDCPAEEINTLYLSGLLHDIGKIGIDDNVLRKPGKLTKEEYEHIKTHPELGYRILRGVKQLDKVLPVVLHHHEAWDGTGYPAGLKSEDCPRLARICAVADSIDAMGSDRPYRKGMPGEKLDEILRSGAGKQWDPEVIDAYFVVRDEIRHIAATEREPLALDVRQWEKASNA